MKAVQLLMQLLDALQALVLRRRRETKRAEPLHVRRSSSTSDQTESAHQRDWAPDTDRQEPHTARRRRVVRYSTSCVRLRCTQ